MRLAETCQIVSGIVPVDSQTAAMAGDYVSLKNYAHCTIIIFKAAGTANDDPVITVDQATDVAGTGSKTLNISEYYTKEGTLTAVSEFTRTTQTAADGFTGSATSAENQAIYVMEIEKSDLDAANNFDCLRVYIADTGSSGAQLICALYILSDPRYTGADAIA